MNHTKLLYHFDSNTTKELIILIIATISLSEIFIILLAASYHYHIRCQSLPELIPLLSRNPILIFSILLSIPTIQLPNSTKQILGRLTFCVTASHLIFQYLFDHMNTHLVFSDAVIIRNGLPILFAVVLSIRYFIETSNKLSLIYAITTIFLLINYFFFFICDFVDINILPAQHFLIKKIFQVIILSIFVFYYHTKLKEVSDYEK